MVYVYISSCSDMALKLKLRLLRLSAKLVLTIFHVCVNKLVDDDDDDDDGDKVIGGGK